MFHSIFSPYYSIVLFSLFQNLFHCLVLLLDFESDRFRLVIDPVYDVIVVIELCVEPLCQAFQPSQAICHVVQVAIQCFIYTRWWVTDYPGLISHPRVCVHIPLPLLAPQICGMLVTQTIFPCSRAACRSGVATQRGCCRGTTTEVVPYTTEHTSDSLK